MIVLYCLFSFEWGGGSYSLQVPVCENSVNVNPSVVFVDIKTCEQSMNSPTVTV